MIDPRKTVRHAPELWQGVGSQDPNRPQTENGNRLHANELAADPKDFESDLTRELRMLSVHFCQFQEAARLRNIGLLCK